MVGRAWMEAQREVEISQSIITRPDSVLELSCFDAWSANAGDVVGKIFSAADSNGSATRTQIELVTSVAMAQYLGNSGFSQNNLGGGTLIDGGLTYVYAAGVGQSFSACIAQKNVWVAFKCKNMIDLRGVVFDALRDNDPRLNYVGDTGHSCPDAGPSGATNLLFDHTDVWEKVINSLNTPAHAATVASGDYFDTVQTFSEMTAPTGACSAAIPTGVMIVQTNGNTTPEMICPNPGCSYSGTACVR
tara:strand:- start:3489 stop:4226 length:738 start_codon:yes stop_codon:yes gene_type:complete